MRNGPLTMALTGLVLGIAACGGDSEIDQAAEDPAAAETEATTPTARPTAALEVTETDFALDPTEAEVEQPGVVRIEVSNEGSVQHALTVVSPAGNRSTPLIDPGESETLLARLGEEGEFTWFCPVGDHRDRGMEGTITVGGGGEEG